QSRGGAVWQLVGLITRRSKVQILPPQPNNQAVAAVWSEVEAPVLQPFCKSGPFRDVAVTKKGGRYGIAAPPSQSRRLDVVGRDRASRRLSHGMQVIPDEMEAEFWAARTEAAAAGRTLTLAKSTTLAKMLDEVTP